MIDKLKVKYFFDASGNLKIKGMEMPKELPLCYGWKKRFRKSPKAEVEEF